MGATSGVFFLLDLLSLFPNGLLLCDHGLDLRDRLMCEFNQSINKKKSDQRLLHDDIVQDIVLFSALMRQASTHPAAERWILSTIVGRSKAKAPRTDSSTSDHSVDRSRPRRRDEPSSGRGATKRATLRSTSDSVSGRPQLRRTTHNNPRQVRHRSFMSEIIVTPHRSPPASPTDGPARHRSKALGIPSPVLTPCP